MITNLSIIAGLWVVFMAYLFIPTLWQGTPVERKSIQYIHWFIIWGVMMVFIIIILAIFASNILFLRVLPDSPLMGTLGIILTVAGLGFSTWARILLGKNWSGMVMVKVGHQLIRTGPYRIVRNPMYTGFVTAYLGAAIAIGEVIAFVAFVFLIAGIWIKIKAEEEILLEKFGEEYRQYRRDVRAALIPWIM